MSETSKLASLPTEVRLQILSYVLRPVVSFGKLPIMSDKARPLLQLCRTIRYDILYGYSPVLKFGKVRYLRAFRESLKTYQDKVNPKYNPVFHIILTAYNRFPIFCKCPEPAHTHEHSVNFWTTELLASLPTSLRHIEYDVTGCSGWLHRDYYYRSLESNPRPKIWRIERETEATRGLLPRLARLFSEGGLSITFTGLVGRDRQAFFKEIVNDKEVAGGVPVKFECEYISGEIPFPLYPEDVQKTIWTGGHARPKCMPRSLSPKNLLG